MRGYFGIGIYHPRKECNLGTLFRSAHAFGADFLFSIGKKYKEEAGDTSCSTRHVPCFHYPSLEDFLSNRPRHAQVVCVELAAHAWKLPNFVHPEQCIYLLGSEGGGLPETLLRSFPVVEIPTRYCLNVAVAGSIIMYDRIINL